MEVYVIRHTRVDIATGICYGQTDLAPGATFETELEEIRNKLPLSFDWVYSSPLSRCLKLAKEFEGGLKVDHRLKEMYFGNWEMKQWSKIPEYEIKEWYKDFVNTLTPEGENFKAVYTRVHAFMEELRTGTQNKKILIVCHAGIIRSIWCYLLNIPLENAFKIPVNFGEVLHLELGKTANDDYIIQKK